MLAERFINDDEILAYRSPKNLLNPWQPYAFFNELERTASGSIESVATLFLTNQECPFRCVMCDLWKNTLDERVPLGAIPAQIDFALQRLAPATHIKLYNSANFFDPHAIPREDWAEIARRVKAYRTVIVENHPRLCSNDCLIFRDLIETQLEVALGLETTHPETLKKLNKHTSVADFVRATALLHQAGIATRAFILLRPPFVSEEEGLEWACRSLEFAFEQGVGTCSIIPTRGGNGILEQLAKEGQFSPPRLESLEAVMKYGLSLNQGRVFVDIWDLERFDPCQTCGPARRARLAQMNLTQEITPQIECPLCG